MVIKVGEKYKILVDSKIRYVEVTMLERCTPQCVMVHYRWLNNTLGLSYTEKDSMGFSSFVDNIKSSENLETGALTELSTEDYYLTRSRR